MTNEEWRILLKRLAKTVPYMAPVITSIACPSGQAQVSPKHTGLVGPRPDAPKPKRSNGFPGRT